ncbi:MAG: FMN-binding negative transcriptional regulator [Acetobacteraceae bacterium]
MYVRPAFAQPDPAAIQALIRDNAFGLLISHGPRGTEASHIPFLLRPDGDEFVLTAHFAAGNPQCDAIGGEALAVFGGPHAYISPGWYKAQPSVPTWDFAAVHVTGRLEPVTDPAEIAADLQGMAAEDPTHFNLADLPDDYRARMFAGIRAFRMTPTRVEAQWKMSQNRSAADRKGVVAALEAQADGMSKQVAALVASTLPDPGA